MAEEVEDRADRPVLVIPGYGAPRFQTNLVSRHLQSAGLNTVSIALPWMAMGDMVRSAGIVEEQARRAIDTYGCEKIDLFGFSLGGLIARYYLQELEGYPVLGRGAFVSSPDAGTYFGYVGFFSPAGRQGRPGSPLIRQLEESPARDELMGKCLSIFVRWDGVIVPCFSSYLPDGYNIMHRRPVSHWRAVMNKDMIMRASEFLLGGMPEGAVPGRELGMIEAGELVAVPWMDAARERRRIWQVMAKPFRSFAKRVGAIFKRKS
ncbi:MAG: esterase/lipase family protein [Candidatus Geothermincolia bacterium]